MIDAAEQLAILHRLWDQQRPGARGDRPPYHFGERSLVHYLRSWAAQRPDRAAVLHKSTSLTFRQLDDASDRVAGWLAKRLPGPGARVAILLPNSVEFMIAFYAILKARAIVVPVNPGFHRHELEHQLGDSQPHIAIVEARSIPSLDEVATACGIRAILVVGEYEESLGSDRRVTRWSQALAHWPVDDASEIDPDSVAVLNYSGGTTGLPKGCAHTHRNMTYTAASAAHSQGIDGVDEVSLVYVPVFWIAGETYGLLLPIFTGTTVILMTRWNAQAAMATIDAHRVTAMLGTVDNYLEILDHADGDRCDLSALRVALAMSFVTKLDGHIRRRWGKRAGAESVLREAGFGMTETHAVDTSTLGFQDGDTDINSRPVFCGLPVPGTELRIVSFETGDVLPLGQEGELAIRSPSLMAGYWNRPVETAAAVRDGWLLTGDIAQLDEQGRLHLLGRRKELIKVNGMSVYPSELELVLSQHPAVAASGVVGVPSREQGERPVAFVLLREAADTEMDPEALRLWCAERITRYKVPDIRIVDRLPMTASGKVQRGELLRTFDPDVSSLSK